MTIYILFNIGQAIMVLYAEGMLTTMNLIIIIFEHGSSPNVMCRFMVRREGIESFVNLVNKEVMGVRSLAESLSFLKISIMIFYSSINHPYGDHRSIIMVWVESLSPL